MEQLLSQDVSVVTLLGLFIIGLLTKRFVPWWVYEEVLKKLKEYEETAPELMDEMQKMMAILEDPQTMERLQIHAPQIKQVEILTPPTKEPTVTTNQRRVVKQRRTRDSAQLGNKGKADR